MGNQAILVFRCQWVPARHQYPHRVVVQASQVDPLGRALPDQRRQELGEGVAPGQLVGPVGGDEEERERCQLAGEVAQQIKARGIGPVKVFQHDDCGV